MGPDSHPYSFRGSPNAALPSLCRAEGPRRSEVCVHGQGMGTAGDHRERQGTVEDSR